MWGEALFNIEEEATQDYTDYLAEQINAVVPIEGHEFKFRQFLEDFVNQMEQFQQTLDLTIVRPSRSSVGVTVSHDEPNENLSSTLAEAKISNNEYKKITTIFNILAKQIDDTECKMFDIFDKLILYGENPVNETECTEGDFEIMVSNVISTLREVYTHIEYITLTILNILVQINALYWKKSIYCSTFKKIDFFFPIDIIGKGLRIILTLDCVIKDQTFYQKSNISIHWFRFRDAVNTIKKDPSKLNINIEKIMLLERMFRKIDKGVMSGQSFNIFLDFIQDDKKLAGYTDTKDINDLRQNSYVKKLFLNWLKNKLQSIEPRLNLSFEINEAIELSNFLCVFTLYQKLFHQESKDIWKMIWSLQKKCPMIYLHRFVSIRIDDF